MTGATQRTSALATRSLSSWLADVQRSWEPSWPDLHVVFAEDVDQWKANDPFTEIWVVMPWDVDADAFHEVAVWLDSRCRFNE